MSSLFSDYDINSEEMNPGSNSSTTLFCLSKANSSSISKTNSTNISKINEPPIYEQLEPNNFFLEINTKNSFKINYNKDYSYLENKLNKDLQSDLSLELKLTYSYLNILFPKCNQDPFSISQNISKLLYPNQKKKIIKEIKEQIEFFINNNSNKKNNVLILNLITLREIGYILYCSYGLFKNYNIDNIQKFKNAVDNIIKKNINIYKDYADFCTQRKKEQKIYDVNKFITKKKNDYTLPLELIFLIKYLSNINTLDINFEQLKLQKNDLYLYILVLINIQIIFPKINFIKINLTNIQFQNDIYSRFFRMEKEALKKTNKYIKAYNYKYDENRFKKKWDFSNSFYIQEIKNLHYNKKKSDNLQLESDLINENIHINEIIVKNSNILSSILITFYSFYEFININKLELIINDSYTNEYQYFFKKHCLIDIPTFFHILNFLKAKDSIKSLNVELNILDYQIAKKIFYLIHKNNSLNELQISFFSSDISYLPQTIYKLYTQYINIKKENKIYFIEEPETEMLNHINKYFEKNLNLLFDIITKKTNLNKLGLYFEVPSILINNQKYMILILKFIINILFLLDDENSKINNLTLLSPFTILDTNIFPTIDDYLEDLEINEKNQSLLYLNIHLKIYKVVNIKKLITTNLIILNIGDFDLFSFEILIDYLISYKFTFYSKLKNLTIGLLKSIIDYDQKIHDLFNKLYSIKKHFLYELNIYTNLLIDSKKKYIDLINIFKYRWISLSTVTLNNLSTQTIEEFKNCINDINYLVPAFVDEIKSSDNKNNNIIKIYWDLKYFFMNKYKENRYKDDFIYVYDKIIYGIFKYLCYERKMTINHNYQQFNK